jgi:hypothetical protein
MICSWRRRKNLFDIRILGLDGRPTQQIDFVDLKAQQAVKQLEAGHRALRIPDGTQYERDQNPEELAQALLVLVELFDQFTETRLEHPSDLPRQDRRQRHRKLDDLFEISTAAFPVAVAERRGDIIGEQSGKLSGAPRG